MRVRAITLAACAVLGVGGLPPGGLTALGWQGLDRGAVSGGLPEAAAARPADPGVPVGTGQPRPHPLPRWAWPMAGDARVVQGFDPPEHRWGRGHRGIDLAGDHGQDVRSVDEGVVTFSGLINGVGIVAVSHTAGLRSTYQPVQDRVPRGTVLERGARIGELATEGAHCSPRPCLHLGAVSGEQTYHDPLALLGRVRPVLLPLP